MWKTGLVMVMLMLVAGCGEKRDEAAERKTIEEATAKGVERGIEVAAEKQRRQAEHDQRTSRMFNKTPEDIAGLAVKDYAYDAYSQWAGMHLTKACPDRLEDLVEYMNTKDTKDPWGHPYRMYCGSTLPAGVRGGIAVSSMGPDGKEGSEDDIKSWE